MNEFVSDNMITKKDYSSRIKRCSHVTNKQSKTFILKNIIIIISSSSIGLHLQCVSMISHVIKVVTFFSNLVNLFVCNYLIFIIFPLLLSDFYHINYCIAFTVQCLAILLLINIEF